MRYAVYGDPELKHGNMMSGIYMSSQAQALVLQQILEDAMKAYAGKAEESLIAKWHGEVVRARRKAERDEWTGWEYPELKSSGKPMDEILAEQLARDRLKPSKGNFEQVYSREVKE